MMTPEELADRVATTIDSEAVDLIRRDRAAVRAEVLRELADEEHMAGWLVLLTWHRLSRPASTADIAKTIVDQCTMREASYRRRAAQAEEEVAK